MRFSNVCLESIGYALPSEVLSSEEIERRLNPLYSRLRLPEGRLELMSGIRERRIWPRRMPPSEQSIVSGERALAAAGLERSQIGALIHGSVCRDQLEPASACRVHHHLGLPADCQVFDLSNACLGLLNGVLQIATMIELGQIRAGLVVGTENGCALLHDTIDWLNRDESLTRETVKPAFASLTIGSASAAILLTHRSLSRTQNRLQAAGVRAHTGGHQLCEGGHGQGGQTLMQTDSERLLKAGLDAGVATFASFLGETGWTHDDIHKSICHQVGGTHRKLMLESLGLHPERDFCTFPWLGNTGSVALPITLAIAAERGFVTPGDHVALLGIGSGVNCLMLAAQWRKTLIGGETVESRPAGQDSKLLPASSAS